MPQDPINLQYTTIKSPLPDFIYDGLKQFSATANAYQPQPKILIDKLAAKHHLPSELFFLTAGIDEAIQMLILTYSKNTFVFTPTYIVYADVEVFGGKLTRLPSIIDSTFTIDPQHIPGASLIFLANPNNPSGFTEKSVVMELIKNNPQAIVVIDEAYGEFAELSVIDEVPKYPNLVVMRSFSKAYSMAGNRVGYIVAAPNIIAACRNKVQWSNISYLSIGAAVVALNHENYFLDLRQKIGQSRDELREFLVAQGFSVLPSKINALLLRFSSETAGTEFAEFLTAEGFIISHGNGNSNIGLDKSFVRIAIGTDEQLAKLRQSILKFHSVLQ